jgi:hypothetical protein
MVNFSESPIGFHQVAHNALLSNYVSILEYQLILSKVCHIVSETHEICVQVSQGTPSTVHLTETRLMTDILDSAVNKQVIHC